MSDINESHHQPINMDSISGLAPTYQPSSLGHKWYIIRVHAGLEKKVMNEILKRSAKHNCVSDIIDYFIPCVQEEKIKQNKVVKIEKSIYSGYIMIKMIKSSLAVNTINNCPGVSGFIDGKMKEKEFNEMMQAVAAKQDAVGLSNQSVKIGDRIKVKSGSFESFEGTVKEIHSDKEKLLISLNIFDRETSIEIAVNQVEILKKNSL